MKGYVQVYTGSGGHPNLAAFGIALRAAGAGLRVFIGQFIPSKRSSEVQALERWADCITVEQFGGETSIANAPASLSIDAAVGGLERIRAIFTESAYQLVILTDANVAVSKGLFSADALLGLVNTRPFDTELVITGRDARPEIIAQADLMTEFKSI